MRLVEDRISRDELRRIMEDRAVMLVKAVIDIARHVLVIDVEYHADAEAFLLNQGSEQKNLWGINLHPSEPHPDWIEFDSMINLRPSQGNRSRGVEDATVRERLVAIVAERTA